MSFRLNGAIRKTLALLPLLVLPNISAWAQATPPSPAPVVPTVPPVPAPTTPANPTAPTPATPTPAAPAPPTPAVPAPTPGTPPATPPATPVDGSANLENHIIASIDVTWNQGVSNTNPDIVQALLSSNGIRVNGPYTAVAIKSAQNAILNQGLYADVFPKATLLDDGHVALTIHVYENPVIKEIRIRTSVPLKGKNVPTEDSLLQLIQSKPNRVMNFLDVRADAKKLQERYHQAGYDAYFSEVDDLYDAKTGILTFPVQITIINEIRFTGVHKTRPSVLLREMKSKPGDPFNEEVIHKDTSKIYALNLFSEVGTPQVEPVDEGRANIVIPVTEQRTGQVQVGFGYSAEQRLTGTLSISENNFRGLGEIVSASWTVGGVVARSQYDFGFTQPWLDKHHTALSINLYDRIDYLFNRVFTSEVTSGSTSDPYYNERKGAALTFSRPVSDDTRALVTLRTEGVTANNLFANDQTLTIDELSNYQGSLVQDGNTNSIAFRTLTNTKDNDRDPSTGLYFSPQVEFGYSRFHYQNPYLNPEYISPVKTPDIDRVLATVAYDTGTFTKVNMDFRRYINLGPPRVNLTDPRRVLATRLLLGTATGNIGFSEQYFMGGADNLRGYADQRFWGNNLFLWSTELRIPIADKGAVVGVLFMDIGDAWGASQQNKENVSGFAQQSGFDPHIGVGPGIRIVTPVGPVRLDYGFGETQRTHFSIGQAF